MSRNVENELPSPFSMERPFRKRVTEQQYTGPEQRDTVTKRAGEHSTHTDIHTYIHSRENRPGEELVEVAMFVSASWPFCVGLGYVSVFLPGENQKHKSPGGTDSKPAPVNYTYRQWNVGWIE